MLYEKPDPAWGKVSHPGYGQKPYVRITLPDGRVFDGRVTAWTKDKVLALWIDPDAEPEIVAGVTIHIQTAWMDAEHVTRIKRSESSWIDPYDRG